MASTQQAATQGPSTETEAPLVADETATSSDADSAYGDEISSYTASLTSSVTDYQYENGRRYHAYRQGSYVMPNDEKEADRLDIHHHLAVLGLGGRLHLAPIGKNPQDILDLGTGTGIWAIDMGDDFPSAKIIGVDLSPTQPTSVPPNVHFEVDDIEGEWTYPTPFNYIHARYLAGAISDWPKLMKQTFKNTAPGGWAEFQDWDANLVSDDDSLKPDMPLARQHKLLYDGCYELGKEPHPGPRLKGWMADAGFVNIEEKVVKMPLGPWPKDEKVKELGLWNLLQLSEGLEGVTMALLTRVHKWKAEEVQVLLGQVRKDLKDRSIHSYYKFYYVYGQKPAE